MKANIRNSLQSIKQKANELSDMLSDPSITSDIDQLTKLNKEFSEVKDIVNNWDEYLELEKNIVDLEELLKDEEMKELASEEKKDNELKLQALEAQIMIQLLPKDKDDKRNAFLELRAGAGGDEAAIFVGDLYRMYVRFSERSNWKGVEVK